MEEKGVYGIYEGYGVWKLWRCVRNVWDVCSGEGGGGGGVICERERVWGLAPGWLLLPVGEKGGVVEVCAEY